MIYDLLIYYIYASIHPIQYPLI